MSEENKSGSCFTKEQEDLYNGLPANLKQYVRYRASGMTQEESYRLCGYTGKNAKINACQLEQNKPYLKALITSMSGLRVGGNVPISQEDSKRIAFYQKILDGEIKSKKVTKTLDAQGNVTSMKVEETLSVEDRMKARKELDRVLGLADVANKLGEVKAGSINITIVDASRPEEEPTYIRYNNEDDVSDVVELVGEDVKDKRD